MSDWPFFGCILYTIFGEGSNSVIVSGRLANLIMISEEHWKNDEISFRNVYGHRESVVLRVQVMLITYCFCDFWFHDEGKRDIIVQENYGIHLTDKGHANLGHL